MSSGVFCVIILLILSMVLYALFFLQYSNKSQTSVEKYPRGSISLLLLVKFLLSNDFLFLPEPNNKKIQTKINITPKQNKAKIMQCEYDTKCILYRLCLKQKKERCFIIYARKAWHIAQSCKNAIFE